MAGPGIGLLLLLNTVAPIAPPPPEPPATVRPRFGAIDAEIERESWIFAEIVADLTDRVAAEFAREIEPEVLLLAALNQLYKEAGLSLPDHFRQKAQAASTPDSRRRVAQQARLALGRVDGLEGVLATVIAVEGFKTVTDPYSGLMSSRNLASTQSDFGLGFELAGADGPRWVAFLADLAPQGRAVTQGVPLPCPVAVPWRISRVLPGSPAATAGLRPGDQITHLNGDSITTRNSRQFVQRLLTLENLTIVVLREDSRVPLEFTVSRTAYTPESIFGVQRLKDGTWDHWLDRGNKIGYIRIGTVEESADTVVESVLRDLIADSARGLVLDLRWCPGGYVNPTSRIAGLFLPEGKTITRIETRHPERQAQSEFISQPIEGREEFVQLPMVVLVGPGTVGGGEMIAAALQDHRRAPIAGQRTFGKANVMTPISTRLNGLTYKVSTGYSLRADGSNRHRFPDSQPTDTWGVRPDRGYELPQLPAIAAELHRSAERQAIRPASDRTAVAFDDPLNDPQKLIAARWLRERLIRPDPADRPR